MCISVIRDYALIHKIDHLEGHHNCICGSKVTAILLNLCKDYSALWHCGNHNLAAESPQISTRLPQTPDEEIGTGEYPDSTLTRQISKNKMVCLIFYPTKNILHLWPVARVTLSMSD